jgi:hypothetical protein
MLSVGDGADSFTFIGDAAHIPALFVANPDWQLIFDMDPEAARMTRHDVLARMVEQGGIVGGYHFPVSGHWPDRTGGSARLFLHADRLERRGAALSGAARSPTSGRTAANGA